MVDFLVVRPEEGVQEDDSRRGPDQSGNRSMSTSIEVGNTCSEICEWQRFFGGELVFEGGNHAHIGEDTRYWKAFFDGDGEHEVRNESRRVDTTQCNILQSSSLPNQRTIINTA